jgi:hypothetical protein
VRNGLNSNALVVMTWSKICWNTTKGEWTNSHGFEGVLNDHPGRYPETRSLIRHRPVVSKKMHKMAHSSSHGQLKDPGGILLHIVAWPSITFTDGWNRYHAHGPQCEARLLHHRPPSAIAG